VRHSRTLAKQTVPTVLVASRESEFLLNEYFNSPNNESSRDYRRPSANERVPKRIYAKLRITHIMLFQ